MKRLLLIAVVCAATALAAADAARAQTNNCPPCYKDRNPMTSDARAHQLPRDPNCNCATAACMGCPGDNRQVIRIRFDTTPNFTWSNGVNANGQVIEPAIYNAVVCAMNAWNTTPGTNGERVPYFFVIDQEAANAQIIVRKEQPNDAPYASISATANPPYTMKLAPDMKNSNWPDEERCGTVKHELGHPLNVGNSSTCELDPGLTIMSGINWNNWRYNNRIFARDVDAAQRNAFNQNTCTGSYKGDAAEPGDGGGGDDPCAGDPCCGDECCYDPASCGGTSYCITYAETECFPDCWVINAYTGQCEYWHTTCITRTWTECY